MRALNKKVLLLGDQKFPRDRADIAGKDMLSFDIEDVQTIKNPLEVWINEVSRREGVNRIWINTKNKYNFY